MKSWFKTYWPLVLVVPPYLFLWCFFLVTVAKKEGAVWLAMGEVVTLVTGVIGFLVFGWMLSERQDAQLFLSQVNVQAREDTLGLLARLLDDAYQENVRLQKGEMRLGPEAPGHMQTELVAVWYQGARRRAEKKVARQIRAQNSAFWAAARLLYNWGLRQFPGSYKECLPGQRQKKTA